MSHCLLTSYQCLCPPPSPPLFSLLLPPPFPLAVSAQHLPACAERVVRPHHRPAPLRGRLGASWSVGASPCLPAAPSPAGKGEKREREGEGGREGGRDKVEGVTEGRGSLPSSHSVEEHPLASEFINLTRITRLPCPFPAPPPPCRSCPPCRLWWPTPPTSPPCWWKDAWTSCARCCSRGTRGWRRPCTRQQAAR